MNNKGFAITTILFGTFVLFCLLLLSLLGILSMHLKNLNLLIDNLNGARNTVTMTRKNVSNFNNIRENGLYCNGNECHYCSSVGKCGN